MTICQQCGDDDGQAQLIADTWLHAECAAYRWRRGIPMVATLDEVMRLTIADVTAVMANARIEHSIRKMAPRKRKGNAA